ncbi:alkaline phosphatase family protein [Acidobacteriota bacterium]
MKLKDRWFPFVIKIVIAVLFLGVVVATFSSGFEFGFAFFRISMHDTRPALVSILVLYLILVFVTNPRLASGRRWLKDHRWLALITFLVPVFALAAMALAVRSGLITPTVVPAEHVATRQSGKQVICIGVDGASFDVIKPLVDQGKLPNIEKLMQEGACGTLLSIESYRPIADRRGIWSPVVWTSIATGKLPHRHGIVDYRLPAVHKPWKTEIAKSYHRRVKALWNILSTLKIRSGVVGWWTTWPAEPVDGFMVSSHVGLRGLPKRTVSAEGQAEQAVLRRLTFPEEYMHVLAENVPPPFEIDTLISERLFHIARCRARSSKEINSFRSVCYQDRYYADIGRFLLETEQPRFLFVYFESTDVASHLFWSFMVNGVPHPSRLEGCDPQRLRQVVPNTYILIDEMIGHLLEKAEEDATVIVISDHGFKADSSNPQGSDHALDGIFIMKGPGIKKDEKLRHSGFLSRMGLSHPPATILDVLPTLLYLYDAPVALDLDGRVLFEAFDEDYVEKHPIRVIETYEGKKSRTGSPPANEDTSLDDELMDRFKALNYIQ